MRHKIAIVLFSLFMVMGVKAEDQIALLYYNHGDSVSLRWAPTSEKLFTRSIKSGYVVQRKVKGGDWQTLSPVLYPASDKQFEMMEMENPDATTVREILYKGGRAAYKEEIKGNKPDYAPTMKSGDEMNPIEEQLLYAMALFSCDVSLPVAKAAALHYVDKSVDRSKVYQYRVIFGDDVKKKSVPVSVVSVNMSDLSKLPSITSLDGEFGEYTVSLAFSVANFTGAYSAYMVERSSDSIHFEPLRERPIVQAFTDDKMKDLALFVDSLPNQDDDFYYRVKGYSPFGIYGPVSNVVKGCGKFKFKKVKPTIDTVIYSKKGYADILWSVKKEYEPRIKGFRVYKTTNFQDFTYLNENLLPISTRQFRDNDLKGSAYYCVVAYGSKKEDFANSDYYFGLKEDSIPPAAPSGLKAVVDSAGVVRVSWNANKESDIMGYKVFFSYSNKEDDFFSSTPEYYMDTVFYDTLNLNTITPSVYYTVGAYDKNFNPSALAPAVKVVRPDTIPPIAVVFKLLKQPKEEMEVAWENSPSLDLDHMELYRQVDDTGSVVLVKKYDLKKRRVPTDFSDSYQFSGQYVRYIMVVYDEAGNTTTSKTGWFLAKGERPGCISNLEIKITCDENNKQIELSWQNDKTTPINRYVIYRKEDDGNILAYDAISPNKVYYIDKQVAVGSKYKYYVRAVSTERTCPSLSTEVVTFTGNIK